MKTTFRLLALAFFHFAVCHAALTDGLVGHWTFSGNADDSSGNGKHGVVSGATLMPDRFGVADRAYHFTLSDKIVTTANLGISGNTARTLSLWVKFEQPSTSQNGNMLAWGNNWLPAV